MTQDQIVQGVMLGTAFGFLVIVIFLAVDRFLKRPGTQRVEASTNGHTTLFQGDDIILREENHKMVTHGEFTLEDVRMRVEENPLYAPMWKQTGLALVPCIFKIKPKEGSEFNGKTLDSVIFLSENEDGLHAKIVFLVQPKKQHDWKDRNRAAFERLKELKAVES